MKFGQVPGFLNNKMKKNINYIAFKAQMYTGIK